VLHPSNHSEAIELYHYTFIVRNGIKRVSSWPFAPIFEFLVTSLWSFETPWLPQQATSKIAEVQANYLDRSATLVPYRCAPH
jgi:hypothetical protein